MCGTTELPPRRRSWCSDECVTLWNLASDPRSATTHLVRLHGSVCWSCGPTSEPLELEHVRPLWSLTDEQRQQLRWWLPYNLQLLCSTCHKAKSRHEAQVRAAWRRGEPMPLQWSRDAQPALL